MRLASYPDGGAIYHSVHDSFASLLSLTLRGKHAVAAFGPIYERDPAAALLAPFLRSAADTDWSVDPFTLAPDSVTDRVRAVRREVLGAIALFEDSDEFRELEEWTRAGLVLEICRAHGVPVAGRGLIRVPWRLRGTATGRFGTEPVRGETGGKAWTFNPLSLGPQERSLIVPSSFGRLISVLDFRAMDICSMVSLVPGLAARYEGAHDLHAVTATIMCGLDPPPKARGLIKEQVFVHAYGGDSLLREDFDHFLPELKWLRAKPHGEGARLVQAQSARAFRAALSEALPLLLNDDVRPMFTVHDELALDHSELASDHVDLVATTLARGASQRIRVPYRVNVSTGLTYEDAKHA